MLCLLVRREHRTECLVPATTTKTMLKACTFGRAGKRSAGSWKSTNRKKKKEKKKKKKKKRRSEKEEEEEKQHFLFVCYFGKISTPQYEITESTGHTGRASQGCFAVDVALQR